MSTDPNHIEDAPAVEQDDLLALAEAVGVTTETDSAHEDSTDFEADTEAGEPWYLVHGRKIIAGLIVLSFLLLSLAVTLVVRDANDTRVKTEAAVTKTLSEQGAVVESVDCSTKDCTVIIGGSTYTVVIGENEDGEQVFGVSAYVGN